VHDDVNQVVVLPNRPCLTLPTQNFGFKAMGLKSLHVWSKQQGFLQEN
jgi:hypothetical protein